jgi:mRNA interferase MazF
MTACRRWDILLVPFPFTDLSTTKKRPALVVSRDAYNAGPDVVIAFITSQIDGPPRYGDHLLKRLERHGTAQTVTAPHEVRHHRARHRHQTDRTPDRP